MAAKRKAISKKTRFEVFKRDGFKCQYCGKCAPDVILHVDHINPVSKGGENDILNYLTSCEDCNQGKSDRLLSDDSVMAKQRAMLDELNERREQLEMMLSWRDGLKGIDGMALQAALDAWYEIAPGWNVNEQGEKELKRLISKYGLKPVLDAIETAEQYLKNNEDGRFIEDSVCTAWQKIGGICRMSSQPDWKRDLYYARGILRNRLHYVNQAESIRLMEQAYHAGIETETLKEIARTVSSWTAFRNEVNDLLEE